MIERGDTVEYYGEAYEVCRVFKRSDLIVLKKPGGTEESVYTWIWNVRKAGNYGT